MYVPQKSHAVGKDVMSAMKARLKAAGMDATAALEEGAVELVTGVSAIRQRASAPICKPKRKAWSVHQKQATRRMNRIPKVVKTVLHAMSATVAVSEATTTALTTVQNADRARARGAKHLQQAKPCSRHKRLPIVPAQTCSARTARAVRKAKV